MGSVGGRGNQPGPRDRAWWPGRPADAKEGRKVKKVPKGVQGESLGAGSERAKAGKKKGCAVLALALAGGFTAAVAVVIGLIAETGKVLWS